MSVSSPSLPAAARATAAPAACQAAPAEIDASCRLPLTLFFLSAAVWLAAGALGFLVASIKLHAPGFLADCSWLTYGRVQPAALNAMVYGFACQAGLGVALWLLGRLGRTMLAGPGTIFLGGLFWNLGVTVGVMAILAGDSTGFEWLEMPGYASMILFFSYALIGGCALLTIHARSERSLYVSQWYLLAALLWFPWIYSAANLLLVLLPVRGIVQAVVNGWFAHNLFTLWLTPLGLAVVFYFIPKLLGRPLHSHYLALFGFWTLAFFGTWGGVQAGAPVPRWMIGLSTVAGVMLLVPVLAVVLNCHRTSAGQRRSLMENPSLRFVLFGVNAYLLASVLSMLNGFPSVNRFTGFTSFQSALTHLGLYGFFAMVIFGAIHEIVPRLAGQAWPSARLVQAQFWAGAAGVALYVLPMAVGGVLQGSALTDATVAFMSALKSSLVFVRIGTLGLLLILVASLALLANFLWLFARACAACCCSASRPRDGTRRRPAEVPS